MSVNGIEMGRGAEQRRKQEGTLRSGRERELKRKKKERDRARRQRE